MCAEFREQHRVGKMRSSDQVKEILLGDDFGNVAVKVNGVRVEVRTDGSIVAYTSPCVDARTNGQVRAQGAANNEGEAPGIEAEMKVGARASDGTVYAGRSPDTGKAIYATPAEAPLTHSFNQARDYASTLYACGHNDWRVPSKAELNVLFTGRAAIGGFNSVGSSLAGWYWSSSPNGNFGWAQRFSDGNQLEGYKSTVLSLRCVR